MNIFSFANKTEKYELIKECFLEENGEDWDGITTLFLSFDTAKMDACNSVKPKGINLVRVDDWSGLNNENYFIAFYCENTKDKSSGYINFIFNKYGDFVKYKIEE